MEDGFYYEQKKRNEIQAALVCPPACLSCRSTFLQIGDPLVQGGEGGLHSAALLRLVAQAQLPLLDAVHPGQHLLLQVVDPALEQVLQAVRLRGLVTSADLLSEEAFWSVDDLFDLISQFIPIF